jgi:hypothetical protein
MQTAKNAAATAMESAANVAASAKAGKDKTMATAQEKVERMTAKDPTQKDMATQRKQEKIQQANCNKQEAMENNAASRQAVASGGTANFAATGQYNKPGAGTQGYTAGGDGLNTQTRPTGGHNPVNLTGSNAPGYGTGQQIHNINDVGANTGTGLGGADAVYPNDPMAGTQGYTAGGDGLNTQTRPTGGHNPVNQTGSNAPGYGTGQQTHNINDVGANTGTGLGGADAVYPNDPMAGPDTTLHANAAGGRTGQGINPGGPNDAPGTGYGTGGTYQ